MLLASFSGVEKVYGDQVVLDDASLELRDAHRLALIGRNGSGKSTVLRLLMGLEQPDRGTIYHADDTRLALLEQDPEFEEGETVIEIAERAFIELDALDEELKRLEHAGLDDLDNYERWDGLHATFERRGGYARRSRRDAVLAALGFKERHDQAVKQLSGGERTRLGLARLLMAQPDVLLLDEPTNHLDIDMRTWLETYLARYPGAAIIVSHDRAFLDGACSRTAEVSRGELRVGEGNPSAYREARETAERIQAQTRANQERESSRLHESATQMKRWAGQSEKLHRRAKAMEKRADRYDDRMVDELAGPERSTRFTFESFRSGDIVLSARHLTKRFEKRLFENVSVELRAGDKVGLVGPNGAGKTTFLRMLLGDLASDDPRAQVLTGSRVRLGYYDQTLGGVDPDATLFEELHRRVGDAEAHDLLGRFLFPFDAQFKKVRDLSGGERARLALLELTLGRQNLLILDEPTNHLDLEMIEALEAALAAYRGTLLIVSHDRRFLSALVTRVWEVRDGRFLEYEGDWEFYLRKHRERGAAPERVEQAGTVPASSGPRGSGSASVEPERRAADDADDADDTGQSVTADARAPASERFAGMSAWQLRRRLVKVETEIAELEDELERVTDGLAAPARVEAGLLDDVRSLPGRPPTDVEIVTTLGSRHAVIESELLSLIEEWHELTDLVQV
ncbi:MAG TPA: ABC-F family ATP-binding cassette domain-containing protein [Trueperaceae bacterium]|nr:ABC-F family ATP-binding cassette domain-containing protein [Trueperaceae bacterium]